MTTSEKTPLLPYPQTPASVKAWIREQGTSQSALAKQYGFDRRTLADLLRGKLKGQRDEAYTVAVLFGLRKPPRAKP
ncbi:DNA-binding protein [Bowmanella denitrificans]|uniref:DNA-binding protein n=1 Tax=Bowmanella denitrificans TaxID=366582 RepID=UPI000C9AE871|nr:DNA-binding protein [Bowmanella denitrificans]